MHDPEVGPCLICSRNSRETSVPRVKGKGGGVKSEKEQRLDLTGPCGL